MSSTTEEAGYAGLTPGNHSASAVEERHCVAAVAVAATQKIV